MAGDGLAGEAAVARSEERGHRVRRALAPADLDKGPDYGADHSAKEPVGCDVEGPVVGIVLDPARLHNCTYRSLVVASGFLETGKVVCSQKQRSGPVHRVEIQSRIAAVPGKRRGERILHPMYMIYIFAAPGIEPCVEIGCSFFNRRNRHGRG